MLSANRGSKEQSPAASLGLADVLNWGIWFGATTALGETTAVALVRALTSRTVFITRDIVWRAPIANVMLYALTGAFMAIVLRRTSRAKALGLLAGVFVFGAVVGPLLQLPRLHPYAAMLLAAGIGVQAARLAKGRWEVASLAIRATMPWVAVPCALLAGGFLIARDVRVSRLEAGLPPAGPHWPNVLFIVLDTVRADSVSLYGYERNTTPRLEALARSGVRFDNAIAPAPWTLPSHAAMFSGRLPVDLSADWLRPLDRTHATLAEALQQRGYVTVGEVANLLYTTSATGLDRGFLTYADFPFSISTLMQQSWVVRPLAVELRRNLGEEDKMVRKSAAEVTDAFLGWLRNRSDRPFFAFLNYFDAHAPYLPPPPYDTLYGGGDPVVDLSRQREWSPAEIQRALNSYEGAITFMDAQLGRLFDELKRQGIAENTLIIVTSDHGEQFGEHGLFGHANSLYRAVLHVPLVVSYPPKVPAGVSVATPVSLVDLASTVMDLVAANPDSHRPFPSRTLVTTWTGGESNAERPVFSEVSKGINTEEWLPFSRGRMTSVVLKGWHYIRNGDGAEELYDLAHDPSEEANRASDSSAAAVLEAARDAVSRTLLKP